MVVTKKRRGRPPKPKDETKSGHKSLRVRARVQFAIELFAGWEGQSDTEYVSTSCEMRGDIIAKKHGLPQWRSLFHPHHGVRWLRVYLLDGYPFTDDHERRRAFVRLHREFFYDRGPNDSMVVNEHNATELFGNDEDAPFARIDAFRATEGDHYAAGRAMAEALRARGIAPPAWPPKDRA